MSVQQFGRKLSVLIGSIPGQTGQSTSQSSSGTTTSFGQQGSALDFADFKLEFQIRRGDNQTPNSCDLRIYNLSDQTAARIYGEFTTVVIQAGYEGNYGIIFNGQIKQVRKGRIDQKDSYVDVTAADGDEAYNFAVTSRSLAAGSTQQDAVSAFLADMAPYGITQGYVPPLPTAGLPRGIVLHGKTRDLLREFCRAYGYTWSIQDGQFTLIPLNAYIPGEIPVISPGTGLIGVPEQNDGGIEIRTLLNPLFRIGSLVKLDSSVNLLRYGISIGSKAQNQRNEISIKPNADGLYYIMRANHSGETRGNTWYSDLICLSVDATVVPANFVQQKAPPSSSAIDRF